MIQAVIFDMYETLITLFEAELYMGHEIAIDLGIPESKFREIWDASDADRTLGKRSFEEVILEIMHVNNCYNQEIFDMAVRKRVKSKEASFEHIHKDVIPMLHGLKQAGVKIGLITNCFLEEKEIIKKSVLFPFFDAVCMSCEMGLKKPDSRIFAACLEKLEVPPENSLYVGDGGSHELETAKALGMHPVQACWYLKDNVGQPSGRKPEFAQADSPLDILKYLKPNNFWGENRLWR